MEPDQRAIDEVNRLYWESEASVAEIAERLDLSRRALYDALHPLEAGAACGQCGTELQFGNRSARRSKVAVCPSCGAEQGLDTEVVGDPAQPALTVVVADPDDSDRADMRVPDLRHRAMVLGSVAIAGVALGTVAALIATRRD